MCMLHLVRNTMVQSNPALVFIATSTGSAMDIVAESRCTRELPLRSPSENFRCRSPLSLAYFRTLLESSWWWTAV